MSNELVLPTVEVVIDGETYSIRMLDGTVGFPLYTRLISCAGSAVKDLGKLDGDPSDLAVRALGALVAGLPQDLYEQARSLFADSCVLHRPDGKQPRLKNVFGTHFAGRYAHMSKWMLECFKVNFADFLDENGPLADLLSIAGKLSQSQKTSTGSPSGS